MTGTALILGPTGRFGWNAMQAFQTAGWTVHPFCRGQDDLKTLAATADVVVNGWNPLYTDWASNVPQLTEDVIAAVQGAEATVIVPGNVYVFGPDVPSPWNPDSPHRATNPLGRIRCAMEQRYREAGVRTIVLRAGDFLDTRASGNWFDRIMIKSLHKGILTYPGDPAASHAWAFLPDLARAAVTLAEKRHDLPIFSDVPFSGYTLTGQQLAQHLSIATGQPIHVRPMAWWPIRALSPVWTMGRCLAEMRYLWDLPHRLDNTPLLSDFNPTPVDEALRQTIQGAGFAARSTQTKRWRLASTTSS
ncbi:MAG: epimerase [Paracoccaceae bacterium]